MGRRNDAVAVPSRDASHTDFPRPFALQAAHMLGVSILGSKSGIFNVMPKPA